MNATSQPSPDSVGSHGLSPRDYGLLAASTLTVMAGATIAPTLPQMEKQFADVPNAALLVKLVQTVPALTIALSAPLSGVVADRIGRRSVLIVSCFLYAFAGASGYLLDSLALILVGRAVLGCAVGGIMTALTALIADLFTGDARTRFLGLQAATSAFGGLLFLTLGGRLAESDWTLPFLVYLFSLPVGLYLFASLPRHTTRSDFQHNQQATPGSDNWQAIALACALAFVGMAMFYLVPTEIPFHLETHLGTTATQSGLAIGCATFASGIVSLLNQRIRRQLTFAGTMALTFASMGVGYTLVWVAPSYGVAVAAMGITGVGMGLMIPNLTLLVVNSVSRSSAGRAAGFLTTSIFLGQFLSPLVSAPLTAAGGSGTTFGVFGFLMLVGASVTTVWPRLRMQGKRLGG